MSFLSIAFSIFLCAVFALYHAVPRLRTQNLIILIASYVFYGWWDYRFIPLLLGISLANYYTAILIERSESDRFRRICGTIAIIIALGALAVFKYFNFFMDNASSLARLAGVQFNFGTASIILPLGISFITFQGMAYVIDVWRGQHAAERDLVCFLAFKAFFPQLVAGPIERAANLLDQFNRPRHVDQRDIERGVWLMILGYAMKVVVADSLGPIVDAMFIPDQPFGWSVVFSTIMFGLQIYGDFCGYSLIAKGVALLFGFHLIWNFRFPYWSTSIIEFWRRWHISLSTWLRDYLYIPLGGNRGSAHIVARNLILTMTLGGFWHGASWNFLLWGLLHGIALVIARFSPVSIHKAAGWLATMLVVFVGWFFFRATTWPVMTGMIAALGDWEWAPVHASMLIAILSLAIPLAFLEWLMRTRGDYFLVESPAWLRIPVSAVVMILVASMVGRYRVEFIYFQF